MLFLETCVATLYSLLCHLRTLLIITQVLALYEIERYIISDSDRYRRCTIYGHIQTP